MGNMKLPMDSVLMTEPSKEKQVSLKLQGDVSYDELESIIANVTWDNPVSNVLFMGKYVVFLVDSLVPWQNPMGEYFKSSFVICAAKPKKSSEHEVTESFCDTSTSLLAGNPLLIKFEKLICPSQESRHSVSVLEQLSMMYNMYPLSESTGKQLLFICSKFENTYKLPFISICHGTSIGSLVLYGSSGKNKTFRMKMLNQGNVCSSENLPSIQNLKASHLEGSLTAESCIETFVYTVYEFLMNKSFDESNLLPVKGAQLSVQCSWSAPEAVLESLPTQCVCFAKLRAVTGDDESGAFVKYKEIKLLKALQQSLNGDSMTWISSDSVDLVLQEISELANEERKKIYSKEYPQLEKEEESLENVIAKERFSLPLPDKLWLIMKNCSSFGDLMEALQFTYKVLAEINFTYPFTSGDLSTISKAITSMCEDEVFCPELSEKRAAELLLEIGVEKMRRDYFEYFINNGFITQDLFNQFTSPELLSLEAVTCLEKLHSVLELTLVCIKQLNLPRSILNEFARNALIMYTTIPEIDLQHVFTFHIPTFDIHSKLNMMRPVVWELFLRSEDKNFMKQSFHRFVTTATHDHIYAPQNYNPKLMLKGASYVYTIGTLTEEKVLP